MYRRLTTSAATRPPWTVMMKTITCGTSSSSSRWRQAAAVSVPFAFSLWSYKFILLIYTVPFTILLDRSYTLYLINPARLILQVHKALPHRTRRQRWGLGRRPNRTPTMCQNPPFPHFLTLLNPCCASPPPFIPPQTCRCTRHSFTGPGSDVGVWAA